jgi:hypothetical protein
VGAAGATREAGSDDDAAAGASSPRAPLFEGSFAAQSGASAGGAAGAGAAAGGRASGKPARLPRPLPRRECRSRPWLVSEMLPCRLGGETCVLPGRCGGDGCGVAVLLPPTSTVSCGALAAAADVAPRTATAVGALGGACASTVRSVQFGVGRHEQCGLNRQARTRYGTAPGRWRRAPAVSVDAPAPSCGAGREAGTSARRGSSSGMDAESMDVLPRRRFSEAMSST